MIDALFQLIVALFNIVWLLSIIFMYIGGGLLTIALVGYVFIQFADYLDKRKNKRS